MFRVTDDDGLIGIIDPDAYESFVSENWTLESLFTHFAGQMSRQTLLLWGTAEGGGFWEVSLNRKSQGQRTVVGPIASSRGRLCLVSYADLTLAAQFTDEVLPSSSGTNLQWTVAPGTYACTIVQLAEKTPGERLDSPDFDINLEIATRALTPWTFPAWFELAP